MPRIGHDPAHPVSNNWPHLRDELVQRVLAQGQPVHLVGHSLGGYLSLMAACKRPALVGSVVLIDSPVVGGWRAHSVHAMKLSGLMKRYSSGRVSQRRRWQWPSVEAAHAHFAAKQAFARWQAEVLRDYIAAGTEADADADPDVDPNAVPDAVPKTPGGVRLAFSREIETAIYNTLPHHLPALLRRHPLHMPVAYLGGTRSTEGRRAGLATTRALVHERIQWIEGSHLFPMERPAETAAAVLRLLG